MRQANADLRDAGRMLADRDERVCVYSIYDATDGVLFDGSPEAVAWLIENGYDDFTYGATSVDLANDLGGVLLDRFISHPGGPDAAAFFASLPARAIPTTPASCPGDFNTDGLIGYLDLLSLLTHWGPCVRCDGFDLDDDGEVSFSDLLLLLVRWGPCPR